MKNPIKTIKELFNKIFGSKSNEPTGKETAVGVPMNKKKRKYRKTPKKVSEMNNDEKTYHFLEQRAMWLSKHGYEIQLHLGKNDKKDPVMSPYRFMMIRLHKMSADGLKLNPKKVALRRLNKWGIDLNLYPGL